MTRTTLIDFNRFSIHTNETPYLLIYEQIEKNLNDEIIIISDPFETQANSESTKHLTETIDDDNEREKEIKGDVLLKFNSIISTSNLFLI